MGERLPRRVQTAIVRAAVILGLLISPTASAGGADGQVGSVRYSVPAELDMLGLHGAGHQLTTSLIDADRDCLYFSDDTGPLSRLRLSDMSHDGAVQLDPGHIAQAALLDSAAGYEYFATHHETEPGQIVKIRLADFTRVATLALDPGEGGFGSAAIDRSAGYAYFGTDTAPGRVVRVRLSDFSRDSTLVLETGEDNLQAAVLDSGAGYAYFGTNTVPGRIVKVRLPDFRRVDVAILQPGEDSLRAAAIDSYAGYAYFVTATVVVIGLRLGDFVPLAMPALPFFGIRAIDLDPAGGFAYIAGNECCWFGAIAKVNLADFSVVAWYSFPLSVPGGWISTAALDPETDVVYLGVHTFYCWPPPWYRCDDYPTELVTVRAADLTEVSHIYPSERDVTSALLDEGTFAYFGTVSGQVVAVRQSDFVRTASLNLPYADDVLKSGVIDPTAGFAYFGVDASPARVIKVRLYDLTEAALLVFNPGESGMRAALIDPAAGYAYFGTASGHVVRVSLANFTRMDALFLGAGVQSAGADATTGLAYFGLANGSVARVRLADLALVDTLQLSGEPLLATAVDGAGGYAYFADVGMDIHKVRLSDFTYVATLTIPGTNYGPKEPTSVALDGASGVAYWGDWWTEERCIHYGCIYVTLAEVVPVRLEDFVPLEGVGVLPAPISGVVDRTSQYAYFGTWGVPGAILRMSIAPDADLQLTGAAPVGVHAGEPLTYTLTLYNDGPQHAATGVALTATLPLSVTFASASPGCAHAGGVVVCAPADLRVHARSAVTISVATDPQMPPGPFAAVAVATASEPDGVPENNTAVVTVTIVVRQAYMPVGMRLGP